MSLKKLLITKLIGRSKIILKTRSKDISKEYLKDTIQYSFSLQEILLFEINIKSK